MSNRKMKSSVMEEYSIFNTNAYISNIKIDVSTHAIGVRQPKKKTRSDING